jgi:hypothetical protein
MIKKIIPCFALIALVVLVLLNLRPLFGWLLPDKKEAALLLSNCNTKVEDCTLTGTLSYKFLSDSHYLTGGDGETQELKSSSVHAIAYPVLKVD